ncbi:hypothetical protein RB614_37845 [Phytohabitans sp. ZYX-F-186]|uniref:Uncharacterized protein n=1 Tax=Phytohabitans maris TaxID=3071409 RepID=A0ABU0ZTA7_9ACTN|nr:hypothetical protein [Phytohabitans sp. ZYX-F-186]MDQ7910273.1 hypothetical protein [Phytohabitans sp. ZYX-F-186]
MGRLNDLIRNAERLDAQRQQIEDISHRAHATGTHIRDQYEARLAELQRQGGDRRG